MGCVVRAIGRGVRVLIVVQAIVGMEVEVVSDPGTAGLWLDRLCTAFETLFASSTPRQETAPVEDLAPVLALGSDLGMPLAANESVAPRHRKQAAGVAKIPTPNALCPPPTAPPGPGPTASASPPPRPQALSQLCRFRC